MPFSLGIKANGIMKKIFVFLLGICCISMLNAQNFNAEFTKALRDDDTLRQRQILTLWENGNDRSAEYYIANFNYHLTNCLDMTSRKLDIERLGKSLDAINEGIARYSDRLDMRCGKIYALHQLGMWDEMTEEIISSIDHSYIIDNKWIYPNEKADKEFFLNIVRQYQADLMDEIDFEEYSIADSLQVLRIRRISQQVLKYYPNDVDALNNEGVTYFFENDFSKALETFLKAEKIDPDNDIVLFNIANIYQQQGNKTTAKEYYERIIKRCNDDAKKKALELIREL